MAAASQRTTRIELGTAVIPLGLENPFRLAEDLATVDILSGGRINPGVSVGTPMLYDHYKESLYPTTHDAEDFSKDRVVRLLNYLRGAKVSDFAGTVGVEQFTDYIQPHSPGLADRVWYGGGLSSAAWAGRQGINYLTSSVVSIDGTDSRDFATIQAEHIDAFRAHHPHPGTARVSHGLVVIPTDSASPAQIDKYRAYAASRFERTKSPQGPRGMLFSPDFVGTSVELAEALYAHAGFQRANEVAFALPFSFAEDDYPNAATFDSVKVVEMLIDAGADLNARDEDGKTPIFEANDAPVVAALVRRGADPNARDSGGQTALFDRYFAEPKSALVAAGADVNARDKLGRTALFTQENPDSIKVLLDAGADIDAVDLEGRSAIEQMRSESGTTALLAAGAKLPSDPTRMNAMIARATDKKWTELLPLLEAAAKGR